MPLRISVKKKKKQTQKTPEIFSAVVLATIHSVLLLNPPTLIFLKKGYIMLELNVIHAMLLPT